MISSLIDSFIFIKNRRKKNYFLKDDIKNLKLVNLGMTNREHYFIFQGDLLSGY